MTNEERSERAGKSFRGQGKVAALTWWNSQQNTIGYPYFEVADEARCRVIFLRAAGHK
jgi:hypothetical protein